MAKKMECSSSGCGAVYFLAMFGALVYFWEIADGFWEHIGAVLQAFVWPAFLVYELLQYLSA